MSLNVEMIRSSFEKAKPIADQVADKFYEILWQDYPQSKALFADTNMPKQKAALINALSYTVDHVDQPEKLAPYLKSMGERHVKYGVKDEHYDWVGSSLIKTFSYFFGESWTQELQNEWIKAYQFIAQTMIEGAHGVTPELNELKSRAQDVCKQLLKDALDHEIDAEVEAFVRAKVRRILYQVLEQESQELLKKAS